MKKNLILKSSFVGMFSQLVNAFISFITRTIFISTLGIDILGVNGVITNILGMLSLAELGFGTAITQSLYKPFINNDNKTISSIMNLYKTIYRYIGLIVFLLGIGCMLFLNKLIKDTILDMNYIYLIYLIQLLSVVSTYFFSYKRTMLYVGQKQYITTMIDLIINILMSIIKIFILVNYKNYILYLIVQIIQNILSNILISIKVNKLYPYITDKDIQKYKETKKLLNNIKDVVFGKVAGFVYGSTDNLIISSFLGVTYVGRLSNYTMLSGLIKTFIGSIIGPLQAIFGNFIHSSDDNERIIYMINVYTFARYFLVTIFLVPFIILANSFISLWIGKEFILSNNIVNLIAMDIFIGIISGPMGEFIGILGLFKIDKIISIKGAIINFIVSIVAVRFIGLEGVLLGTVISQIVFWVGRAKGTFINNKLNLHDYKVEYIKSIAKYIIVFIINILLNSFILRKLIVINNIFEFIIGLMVCILLTILIFLIFFCKNTYFRYLYKLLLNRGR